MTCSTKGLLLNGGGCVPAGMEASSLRIMGDKETLSLTQVAAHISIHLRRLEPLPPREPRLHIAYQQCQSRPLQALYTNCVAGVEHMLCTIRPRHVT